MSTCNKQSGLQRLELPGEFEDLSGLLQTDIRAIVSVLSERATTCMIWLQRLPDLKASIVSASFLASSPMIEGMPWSRPSRRWHAAHIAAS